MKYATIPVVTGRFFSALRIIEARLPLTECKQASEQPRAHPGEVILQCVFSDYTWWGIELPYLRLQGEQSETKENSDCDEPIEITMSMHANR